MKKTPLYQEHCNLNAQIVDFAGWQMPVRYSGIIPEHLATRNSAGLFDVSHMGEILITGKEAEACINYLCCNDLSKIVDGQAQYSALLNETGGVIDDLIIYRFNQEKYLLCVNASNTDNDFKWLQDHNQTSAKIENLSLEYGQIAIQGPKAVSLLEKLIPDVNKIQTFRFAEHHWNEQALIVARTGYTGEDGFEIYCPEAFTAKLWQEILQIGGDAVLPCGLGARDTLRLEAGYPLHGHELSPDLPALSSGLAWIIKLNKKSDFIGKATLTEIKAKGNYPKLVGFESTSPGIVREETKIFSKEGEQIGVVTSGTKTPTVNKAIGMAIVNKQFCEIGTGLDAEVRGRKVGLKIVQLPFYKKS